MKKRMFMYALIGILVLIGSVLYLENFNYHKLHSAVRDNNTIVFTII